MDAFSLGFFGWVYWLSTTVVIVSWLFGIRHYKRLGWLSLMALTFYVMTALFWELQITGEVNDTDLSDMLYDVAVMLGSLCIVRGMLSRKSILSNSCLKKDCNNRITK